MLLEEEIRGRLEEISVFGPSFSSHVWSIAWVAIVWPSFRLSLGARRCTMDGKNPSILEKW